ncbi:MAG: cytochrome c maturation protein CcmE [Candidatus Eisenbacteria bacterium]|nr:cytochrome c maturation protein CcmE [Candidatus Eisenbacteria bacterium]
MEGPEFTPNAGSNESRGGGGARRIRFVVGFVIILSAIGILVARGAKTSMVYYVTVTELLSKPRGEDLKGIRVIGKVVEGTIQRQDFQLAFEMTDGEKAIPVAYNGVVPDTFGEKGEVVVEGKFLSSGTFEANFLMAKCPSKYEMSPDDPNGTQPGGEGYMPGSTYQSGETKKTTGT